LTLGLDHCRLVKDSISEVLTALHFSPSKSTIQKLYLKKNELKDEETARKLCQLISIAPQLETVHLNWTGI